MTTGIVIETTCGCNVFSDDGLFSEPDECSEVIKITLEGTFEEAREVYEFKRVSSLPGDPGPPDADDEFTICFAVTCPACKAILEWPQVWTVAGAENP